MIEKKRVVLLGSTGSIGCSTLKVVRHLGYEVVGLAALSNKDLFEQQVAEFKPKWSTLVSRDGDAAMIEMCMDPEVDVVVVAVSGAAALRPTLAAAQAGKRIALATKEVLVAGGPLLKKYIEEGGAELIPVDSEHSALFQCLMGEKSAERLILTASGGPFLNFSAERLEHVTIEEALKHPNWSMGAKITVDSSTLMNKGLEVIEAYYLFDIPDIEVVIHPQSLVHSMVEFADGSIKAQISQPDMTLPIQFALTYPERREGMIQRVDWTQTQRWDFAKPDLERFPCLGLALESLKAGGTTPCFLNAANEVLVQRFLKGKIRWKQIGYLLEDLIGRHLSVQNPDIETILEVDREARHLAEWSV